MLLPVEKSIAETNMDSDVLDYIYKGFLHHLVRRFLKSVFDSSVFDKHSKENAMNTKEKQSTLKQINKKINGKILDWIWVQTMVYQVV